VGTPQSRHEAHTAKDRIYTMRELNQHTADVLKEINDDGRPAMITRRGRFIAMIVPLTGADVESKVIAAIINETENRYQLTGEHTVGSLQTTEEIKDDLQVNLPDYPDKDNV
jgi:prevent-host-death family protein